MTEKMKLPRKPGRKPKEAAQDPETASDLLRLDEQACVLLCVEYDEKKAAIEMGWDLSTVMALLEEPRVKEFIRRGQDHFFRKYAQARVNHLLKIGVTKGNIENRLMQLAMMDPTLTKGSIEGQVKALATLADKFGYGKDRDPVANMTPDQQKELIEKANRRLIEGSTGKQIN